ncbi:tryptophanase [Candidatus Gracilibacteria bacterium]|nr:tryptophanase [Candidatus Gracilibacteria bacterium]
MDIPSFLQEDRDEKYKIPLYVPTVVRTTTQISRQERIKKMQMNGYNVFRLDANDVSIDLLTDSGTGIISDVQLSRMMLGDESYAGARSFYRLKDAVTQLTGLSYIVPTHQGRGAEQTQNVVMTAPLVHKERERFLKETKNKKISEVGESIVKGCGDFIPQVYIPGNTQFDTTVGNIEYVQGIPVDLTIDEGKSSKGRYPFKGNIDVKKLDGFLKKLADIFGMRNIKDHVPFILLTITCNSGGGQPVSMENIKATRKIANKYRLPLFFDAARFAENAFFIKTREEKYKKKNIREIVREMFDQVDGCTMSAKKDGIVPMGGFIAVRDRNLYEDLANANMLFEGYKTYGGMSGMMMEAVAVGLMEATEYSYLFDRISLVHYLGEKLKNFSIPIVEPIGGHAVFVDGREFYKGIIHEDQFPAQALTAYLYIESGIRGVEIGSCLSGRDPLTGRNRRPSLDLMRLTIPRRKYNQSHMDVVAQAIKTLYEHRKEAKGFRITKGSEPRIGIRHFSCKFELAI